MPKVRVDGIELEVESFGSGPPIVLVMGIGAQLVYWPHPFCKRLAQRGFEVIRFDHRDVGLSTRLEKAPVPDLRRLLLRWLVGLPVPAAYTLWEMADDVAGLIRGLGHDRAHVVGISMGGMIGQCLAIRHPERLRSLVSMMAHPGGRWWSLARPGAVRALFRPLGRDRESFVDWHVRFYRTVGSPRFPLDEELVRRLAGQAFDRGRYPAGFLRHTAAVLATGSRVRRLAAVRTPTLVLHGTADPLVRPAAGRAVARAIPGARLRWIDGLGHDLPEAVWPEVLDAIAQHAQAAERTAPSTG